MSFLNNFKLGDRVKLKNDVDHFPHGIAKEGLTGVVSDFVEYGEGEVVVKIDNELDWLSEWNNELVCESDDLLILT